MKYKEPHLTIKTDHSERRFIKNYFVLLYGEQEVSKRIYLEVGMGPVGDELYEDYYKNNKSLIIRTPHKYKLDISRDELVKLFF